MLALFPCYTHYYSCLSSSYVCYFCIQLIFYFPRCPLASRENLVRYFPLRFMAMDRPVRRRSRSPPPAQPLGYRPSPFFAPPGWQPPRPRVDRAIIIQIDLKPMQHLAIMDTCYDILSPQVGTHLSNDLGERCCSHGGSTLARSPISATTFATQHPDQQPGALVSAQVGSTMQQDNIGVDMFPAAPTSTGTPSYISVDAASTCTAQIGDYFSVPFAPSQEGRA